MAGKDALPLLIVRVLRSHGAARSNDLFQANESAPAVMPLLAANTDSNEIFRSKCTANNNPGTSF
jgi:hypothetical protein